MVLEKYGELWIIKSSISIQKKMAGIVEGRECNNRFPHFFDVLHVRHITCVCLSVYNAVPAKNACKSELHNTEQISVEIKMYKTVTYSQHFILS